MSDQPTKPLPPPPQRWSRLIHPSTTGSACPTDSAQSKRWRKLFSNEQH